MIGKIMGMFFKTMIFLFGFWLLTSVTIDFARGFLDDYDVFDTEDTKAIVTEKVSVNNLTSMPKYFVIVDLNEKDGFNGVKNRISAWQFKRLSVGDSVKGYYIHGEHFFTTRDIITDSFGFVFVMFLMIFFIFALVMWPVFGIMKWHEKQKKPLTYAKRQRQLKAQRKAQRKGRKKQKETLKPFLKRILPDKAYRKIEYTTFQEVLLISLCMIALVIAGNFTINGLTKLSPIGKTKATAFVTDANIEYKSHYYSRNFSDSYYTLDMVFEDHKGNDFRVIKEVSYSTYKEYEFGGPIEIAYVSFNPYNIFVRDYSIGNLFEVVMYSKFLFPCITLLLLFVFLGLYFRGKKKKRKKIG